VILDLGFGILDWRKRRIAVAVAAAVAAVTTLSQCGSRSTPHATLAARPLTRAYEGAPPVIPHPVRDYGRGDCLSCHGDGLKADAEKVAVPKPHVTIGNCLQCHVEQVTREIWRASQFTGWHPKLVRHRAYPGAPPVIPHRVWMREDCLACHGERGYAGIRTPHPERVNCRQCHIEQMATSVAMK